MNNTCVRYRGKIPGRTYRSTAYIQSSLIQAWQSSSRWSRFQPPLRAYLRGMHKHWDRRYPLSEGWNLEQRLEDCKGWISAPCSSLPKNHRKNTDLIIFFIYKAESWFALTRPIYVGRENNEVHQAWWRMRTWISQSLNFGSGREAENYIRTLYSDSEKYSAHKNKDPLHFHLTETLPALNWTSVSIA